MRRWMLVGIATLAVSSTVQAAPPRLDDSRLIVGVGPLNSMRLHALNGDGTTTPLANGTFWLSDLASAPGCPTIASGTANDEFGFSSDGLFRIEAGNVTPAFQQEAERWAPIYGAGCALTYARVIRIPDSDSVQLEIRVVPDTREEPMPPGRVVSGAFEEILRAELGVPVENFTLQGGPALADGDVVVVAASDARPFPKLVARIRPDGEVRWLRHVEAEGTQVRLAGDRLVADQRIVLDLETGRNLGSTPLPVTDVRPDGSQALAISAGAALHPYPCEGLRLPSTACRSAQALVTLEGALFDEVAAVRVASTQISSATFADPRSLP